MVLGTFNSEMGNWVLGEARTREVSASLRLMLVRLTVLLSDPAVPETQVILVVRPHQSPAAAVWRKREKQDDCV